MTRSSDSRAGMPRRAFLTALAGAAALGGSPAWAAFPEKPVRFIVPFGAGSGTDMVARILSPLLEASLGVPVVVENRPGAGGMLGSDMLSKAAPDGYTVGITSSATHSASPFLYASVPYDPIKGFVHITNVVGSPMVLVVQDGFATDFADFRAKARLGTLSYGYGSSTSQVAAGTFAGLAKIEALSVPYKSQPQAITDLIGGQVSFVFADVGVLASFLRAGRIKALAITSPERSPRYPQVPTLDELGIKDFDLAIWVGLGLPAGTPRAIAERWNTEILKELARADVKEKFNNINADVAPNGIEVHTAFVQRQYDAWGRRIKQAGLKPE